MARQNWMKSALCKDLTPKESDRLFFIGPGQSSKRAKIFCAGCSVKRECNNFATTYDEVGIWAGNTEEDRRSLDPFIKTTLRATAESKGNLESRNLNDFIQQTRNTQAHQMLATEIQALNDRLASSLKRQELLVAQLEALTHPSDSTTYPQASGH